MTNVLKFIALIFCVNIAAASDSYYYYGLETGTITNFNKINVNIPADYVTVYAASGDLAFQAATVVGKKHFLDSLGTNIAYEGSVGYNSFDKVLVNYVSDYPSQTTTNANATISSRGGLFYEVSSLLGQEWGDHNLYLITKLRSERWTIATSYPVTNTSDEQRTTNDVSSITKSTKSTQTSVGIGFGTELGLSDKITGRLHYVYYLPKNHNSTSTIDGIQLYIKSKTTQQTVTISALY